jgi:[ribosomal protein S5]-alanine N-acetyltransferase
VPGKRDPARTEQVILERPAARHRAAFVYAARRSRDLHRGWVSPPSTRTQFERYVNGLRRRNREGFLVVTGTGGIAGVINVSEIVRGSFQSAYLGYYAFEPLAQRGFMRQGLQMVIAHCFGKTRLHRLEANVQPENLRSIALVRSLGFRCEGLSPRYLKVVGRWRDHQRWALLIEDWKPNGLRRGQA